MQTYQKKQWKNRKTQYPERWKLTNVETNKKQTVLVERKEGVILEEGDAFEEEVFNDLERRIEEYADSATKVFSSLFAIWNKINRTEGGAMELATLKEKIEYTEAAIDAIQQAIIEKGIPVPDSMEIGRYADQIRKIGMENR